MNAWTGFKGVENMYKLVIIWETGEKEEHLYNTKEEAENIERGMHKAFGKQISWTGIVEGVRV